MADEFSIEVVDHVGLKLAPDSVIDLVTAVLQAEQALGCIVVAFVEEHAIEELNARYRLPEATDVLSFRHEDELGQWGGVSTSTELGEVVVCPAVVRRYAVEEGASESGQLGWTLIHGVLHLLGYDHETDDGEMRAREQQLIGCLAPLIGRLAWIGADDREDST
jgi:probable rRNA maturation factor